MTIFFFVFCLWWCRVYVTEISLYSQNQTIWAENDDNLNVKQILTKHSGAKYSVMFKKLLNYN